MGVDLLGRCCFRLSRLSPSRWLCLALWRWIWRGLNAISIYDWLGKKKCRCTLIGSHQHPLPALFPSQSHYTENRILAKNIQLLQERHTSFVLLLPVQLHFLHLHPHRRHLLFYVCRENVSEPSSPFPGAVNADPLEFVIDILLRIDIFSTPWQKFSRNEFLKVGNDQRSLQ